MKQNKEQKLNHFYSDNYTEDQAVDQLIYLTNKNRGQHTTEANIRKQYRLRKLGTLLKRLDTIAFQLSDQ
jgi:hypothetical protein